MLIKPLLIFFAFSLYANAASQVSPEALASQYSLTTSTSFPFPTATSNSGSEAQNFINSGWSLSKGRIIDGASNLYFVNDPFPSGSPPSLSLKPADKTPSPVLQVTYPAGSYSHNTGGAQLYGLWNRTDGKSFQSMIVTYEVAFDSDFGWVKGGKLPGLRGGPDTTGCSGGVQPEGDDCFSTRVMWRRGGAGEVYGYLQRENNLCGAENVKCNKEYGVSFWRGAFNFASGKWNRITLLVQLNDPPTTPNGHMMLFYNDQQVFDQQGLQFRTTSDVTIGGLYFSTFFGGNDATWATENTTHTYFRNINLYGGSGASTLSATSPSTHSNSVAEHRSWIRWSAWVLVVTLPLLLLL